jgi:pectate lyase
MKQLFLFNTLLILLSTFSFAQAGPIGWASVNANGQDGTTGGAGGNVVTVNNMNDLITWCGHNDPYIIQIEGTILITPKGRHIAIKSNKSIIGITADAGLSQGGFSIGSGQKNIIIQNLTIADTYVVGDWDGKETDWDGIQIKGTCHHIWVDHCTLLRQGDGAIDISNGADYITISNTIFGQNNKASLIGSSDTDIYTDRYRVTIHHSWFNQTTQRNPRVRFGKVHLFNNYYFNMGGYGREMGYANSNGYGIGIGVSAQIYSENNSFERVVYPSQFYDTADKPGYLIEKGSHLVQSGGITNRPSGITWDPANHYSYTLDDAQLVKDLVMAKAGAGLPANISSHSKFTAQSSITSYPNPITHRATLTFEVPTSGNVSLTLHDLTGRVVKQITQGQFEQGKHQLILDRDGLNAGIYFITLQSANHSVSSKVIFK